MKYLVISRKAGPLLRGSYESARRFCEWVGIDFVESNQITKIEQLNGYDKVIFRTHGSNQYNVSITPITLNKINHLIYTRFNQTPTLYNSCTNGFYYFKNYTDIKHYIPMISPFKIGTLEPKKICLGFYERNCCTLDAYKIFKEILNNLKVDVDIYFMGNPPKQKFENITHVKTVKHTFDNKKFFKSITHYVIPDSKYSDTFTNSMMEAVQCNKQIISPPLKNKKEKHGIDDIKDCIKYHIKFDPDVYYDNSNTILKAENFKNFYRMLLENNFEYSFDRNKFKSFEEWIEREVL